MNRICDCIDSLNAIDDSVFFAECDVMLANKCWNDKVAYLVEHCEDVSSMMEVIQEADTTGTRRRSSAFIDKVITFIRRCINKIIDMLSDFFVKMKTRKAEYIEVPYEPKQMIQDIVTAREIDMNVLELFSNLKDNDPEETLSKIKQIQNDLDKIQFFKLKASNKRYGVKKDTWMKLREEIRSFNRSMKDTQKFMQVHYKRLTETFIRISIVDKEGNEKVLDTRGKKADVYSSILSVAQNIYTKLATFTTKVMASFKFRGVTEMSPAIEQKVNNIEKHADELRKLVEYDIIDQSELDDEKGFFSETYKPYDEWLKKHNYDPKTNTIEYNGKRVDARMKPTTKEKNRINRFLRENDFDPETETIRTDIKDANGNDKRIKFDIRLGGGNQAMFRYPEGEDPYIRMNRKEMSKKPGVSNQVLKHEEGHFNQYDTHGRKLKNVITDENEVDDYIKNNKTKSEHQTPIEYDADLYGYQHSPYSSKGKNKAGLGEYESDERRYVEKEFKYEKRKVERDYNKKRKKVQNAEDLRSTIETYERKLKILEDDIEEVLSLIQSNRDNNEMLKDLQSESLALSRSYNRTYEKLEKAKEESVDPNLKQQKIEEIDAQCRQSIQILSDDLFRYVHEARSREKYLDQHADEAGSKARKLEGRQGKHKGKK